MATEYNIARAAGQCMGCARALTENEEYVAVLVEQGEQFVRGDWCTACWDKPGRETQGEIVGIWRTRIPIRQEKKKLFIDDALLMNFFQRLAGEEDPARLNFRFVLALVLMRKKMLNYEGSRKDEAGREVWIMRTKGSIDQHEVLNPRLDEEKIAQVGEQLREILQGEL